MKRGASVLLALAWLAPGGALAEAPAPADAARADALFHEAKALLDARQIEPACEKFAESERLDPQLGTLLNLADCHDQAGRTATALAEYEDALAVAVARHDAREDFARQEVAEMATRLSLVRLVLASGATVDAVSVDGAPLTSRTFGAPFPVDPGAHVIVLSAAGKTPHALRLVVASAPGTQDVDVEPLADAPRPSPPPPVRAPEPSRAHDSRGRTRIIGFALGGSGLAALVVGSYFGVSALSSKHEGDALCAGMYCDARGLSLESDAHTQATLSTIFFGVAIAALGAGAFLALTRAEF